MLLVLRSDDHDLLAHLANDPVRPHIPAQMRLGNHRDIFALKDDSVRAVTCVSYQSSIPDDEDLLFEPAIEPVIAVFYSIWSYRAGSAATLLLGAVDHIRTNHKQIQRFVTLSPKTEMAHRFHTKNGAQIFRENAQSINYEYCFD